MDAKEVGLVKEVLLDLLSSNNDIRGDAEKKLDALKANSPDKYMVYLIEGIRDTDLKEDVRVMAGVILRRNMWPADPLEPTIWMLLSPETRVP